MKDRLVDAKDAKKKLQRYVPPGLVDYGSVTKITGTPKAVSGGDNIHKKGSCLLRQEKPPLQFCSVRRLHNQLVHETAPTS